MDLASSLRKYSKYSREMRLELIRLVDGEKLSTAHAARLLGIKQTSACRIMKSYHTHNKIFERKADRLSRQLTEPLPSHLHPVEENAEGNFEVENRTNFIHQRTPLSILGGNSSSIAVSEHGTIQELHPFGGGIPLSMTGMTSPCFPYYYTGMYPLMFNCFV